MNEKVSLDASEIFDRKSLLPSQAPSFLPRPTPAPAFVLCGWYDLSTPCSPALLSPPKRFVCGLTLTSPHCVSCTVIHGRVLGCQAAHLHVGCAGGLVCSYGDSALELLCVVCVTISRVNSPHPLKALSWGLSHPVHPVAGEGVSRSLAGDLH